VFPALDGALDQAGPLQDLHVLETPLSEMGNRSARLPTLTSPSAKISRIHGWSDLQ
jgi:hypothetical protein